FTQTSFVSDIPFEALLVLKQAEKLKLDTIVYQYPFLFNDFFPVKEEQFGSIYSFMGLSFDFFQNLLEKILILLKVNGIFLFEFPAYWYLRDENNETEKTIVEYSKQNEKKWLFIKPLDQMVEEHKCQLLTLQRLDYTYTLNRTKLAYLSSLEKLHKAEIDHNRGHLEICQIPEKDIKINSGIMIIKKAEKVLTKDNLFNF
ncbi:MAG: hypothetical protein MJB14_20780, partial [Spirochaetes bacterium]|nr:hypothetical protein [Spirochaetota bacterium]